MCLSNVFLSTYILRQYVHLNFFFSSFFFVTVSSHWTYRSLIVHFSHDSSWPLSSPCDIQTSDVADVIYLGATSFHVSTAVTKWQQTYFLQIKNDSSIRTIRLFVIWHFLGFRICQIRQDTIVSDVRQQFRAWVRDLFWQQSDWPIHRILKRVIWTAGKYQISDKPHF
jgi:hypothetical protein